MEHSTHQGPVDLPHHGTPYSMQTWPTADHLGPTLRGALHNVTRPSKKLQGMGIGRHQTDIRQPHRTNQPRGNFVGHFFVL